ncbi:MAG: hypothetical protein PQJ49_05050 [Sphaerochaetaceae bacterium]|nr:hypothetical protein [Sphaerochaetaceae bacterium]
MQDFKLSEDEQIVVDIFYTSMKVVPTFSGMIYEVDTTVVEKTCKDLEVDYMFTLKACKRLLLIENKKLNDK